MDFYKQNDLVIFTLDKIETYLHNGEEKKQFVGIPKGWASITLDNMADYVKENYKAIGVLTGKKSNITVIDFDNMETYEKIIKKYPELNKSLKVKTRKGYHLYFKYDARLTNNTDVFKEYIGVDIRNDGGFVIGAESSYRTLDGKKHKYEYIEGKMIDFPEYLIAEIKSEKLKKPKSEPEPKLNTKEIEKKFDKMEVERLLELLDDKRATDFEDWRNVGFIINNELGEDGFELFDEFSQRTTKKSDYNKTNVFKFYSNIKKKDSGLKIGSLHKMAQEDNPKGYEEAFPKKKPITNYKEMKMKFETTHFKIMNPVGYGCLYENNLVIKKKSQMIDTYENHIYVTQDEEGNKRNHEFIKEWFKDPEMKTYDKIDFKPCQQTPNNIYNTFKGFEVINKELHDINITETKLYEHLFNLSGRDKECLEYFLNCLTNMVKQPYKLTTTSLILRSDQGCGKDTFFNYFGNKILGSKYYANDSKTELFFGRFNSSIQQKILVVINETSHKVTKDIIENLKDAVTKEVNNIEIKGQDPRQEQNNIFYVFLTNNKNPLPITEEDRRFCAMECNSEIKQNTEYFKALYDELDSGKVDKAFYEFLMKRDISNIDFSKTRPKTQIYKEMKERNIPALATFFSEKIVNHKIDSFDGMSLFNLFDTYLYENKIDYKISNTKFGIDIKDYKGVEKRRTSKGIEYKVDKKVLKEYLIKKGYYEELPEFLD